MKKEYQQYLPHLILLGLLIALRVASAYNWRIDSDEPQHLHIVWAWANGMLQYRDVFDNHAPLFHMLAAPIYASIGERADVLVLMRLALIPLFLLSLWAVFLLGKTLFSRRSAFWIVLLTALFPKFFLTSLEFRADDLWIVPWFFALVLLVRQPLRSASLFGVGILLGTAAAVSMKTSLLVFSLIFAVMVAIWLERSTIQFSISAYCAKAGYVLIGFVVVPLACVLFFAAKQALPQMYYGIIQHNLVPGLGHWRHVMKTSKVLLGLLPFMVAGVWAIRQTCADSGLRLRRSIVFLTFSFALCGLYAFWPLITRQDFLPIIPLAIVIAVGILCELMEASGANGMTDFKAIVPVILIALELTWLLGKVKPWHPAQFPQTRILAETLRLTGPKDDVLDLKGETVFRRRPFYYALEGVTRKRIQLGLIRDSIPEDIVRTKTTVAAPDSAFFPSRARLFLNSNFVGVGSLRVAGKLLQSSQAASNGDISFEISVPTAYVIVDEHGLASGVLDGQPCNLSRELMPGVHVFHPARNASGRWAIVWAPAVMRGFSPFTVRQT